MSFNDGFPSFLLDFVVSYQILSLIGYDNMSEQQCFLEYTTQTSLKQSDIYLFWFIAYNIK